MRPDAGPLCLLAAALALVPAPALGQPLSYSAVIAEKSQSLLDRVSAEMSAHHHWRLPPARSLPAYLRQMLPVGGDAGDHQHTDPHGGRPPPFAQEAAATPEAGPSRERHGVWETSVPVGLRGWSSLFPPAWSSSRPAAATIIRHHHSSALHDEVVTSAVQRFYAHESRHQHTEQLALLRQIAALAQQQQQQHQRAATTTTNLCSQRRRRLPQSPDRIAVVFVLTFLVFVVMVETGKTACQRIRRSLSGRGAIRLEDDEEGARACACRDHLLSIQASPAPTLERHVSEAGRCGDANGECDAEKRDS